MGVSFPTLSLAGPPTDGVNEVQSITAGGTWSSGTFTLTVPLTTEETDPITFAATAAQVAAALNALPSFADTEVSAAGGPLPATPINVTFIGPQTGGKDLDLMTGDVTSIVGAGHTITIAEETAGVRGSYRGVQGGAVLMDTTNARVYQNSGNAQTPVWAEYTP